MKSEFQSQEMQQARAQVYMFFSGVFREPPTQDFVNGLLSEAGLEMIKELFPGHKALGELRALMDHVESGSYSLEDFHLDFEGLIRVPGTQYVQPYESAYRQQQSTPGKGRCKTTLLGEPAYQVSALYQKAGLEPAESGAPFPDELAVELEFMGHLCRRAATFPEAHDQQQAEEAISMQNKFLSEHLLCWAPACLEQITVDAATSLYRILSRLLIAFLEQEQRVNDCAGRLACRRRPQSKDQDR